MANSEQEEDTVLSDSFCILAKSPEDERFPTAFRRGASIVLQNIVRRDTSLGQWLFDIRRATEVECLNALHAKEIAETVDLKQALAVRCSEVTIRKIRHSSIQIINEIDDLIDRLPISLIGLKDFAREFKLVHRCCLDLIGSFHKRETDENLTILSEELVLTCESIRISLDDFLTKRSVNNPQLESHLRKLKENLGGFVDNIIKKECQIIFSGLYAPKEGLCLKWTLLALKSITNGDAYICRIFAENDSLVKKLVELLSCHMTIPGFRGSNMLRSTALRIMYYLCINLEAVRLIYKCLDLEKHILVILQSEQNGSILRELAGLLVPLTTPFIDYRSGPQNDKSLTRFIKSREDLVLSLLRVLSTTKSKEIFLLATWSLANISFHDPDLMIKSDVLSILIAKTRTGANFSDDISIKDQVLTILANVSGTNPIEVVKSGGLVYLISAIQIRPVTALRDDGEMEIIERMQKKVATALTRLAINSQIASLIYRLKGCHRLVQICKDPKERNASDTVLVASLIAFRRIYSALNNIPLAEMDCEDLVHLSFEEAFKTYSRDSESNV